MGNRAAASAAVFVSVFGGWCLAAIAAESQPAPTGSVSARVPREAAMVGVNLAGGEFGRLPGTFNREYTYPGPKQFDYFKAKGLPVVRLPFRWERLQAKLMGPLDEAELARLDATVKLARDRDVKILLDVHNYAHYRDQVIGTAEVPNEAFADFWKKVAAHYQAETAIFAYGLMNEPHDTGGRWPAAAQAAIDAIRQADRTHTICVCGDGWSGAHSWKSINNKLVLRDPAQNLLYEAHQYFDRDHSGTYRQSYDDAGASPDVGAERLRPFVQWLAEHHARGFIGEFGVPDDDPRWLDVLDNFLAAMKQHKLGGTYWAAGPWWGDYPLSVEPRQGKDRPQMEVLALYAGDRVKPKDAKTTYADAASKTVRRPRPASAKPARGTGTGRVLHDLTSHKESYHYSNEGTEFQSEAAESDGRKSRKITYKHHGAIAWVGVGLYFGAADCSGCSAFRLAIRAQKPCTLEVKAYHSDKDCYTAKFPVGAAWQELNIPFASLKGQGGSFAPTRKLLKVELQPSPDRNGSSIELSEFRLAP